MTLTDRETKIILVKYIIHGVSPFSDAPLSTRRKMLKAAVQKCNLKYDEDELLMIGQECLELQGSLNKGLMKYLENNKDVIIKAHQELYKGNDSLKKELGEDLSKEGLEKLSKPKWYDKFR